MVSVKLQTLVKALKDTQKLYTSKHKEFLAFLHEFSVKPALFITPLENPKHFPKVSLEKLQNLSISLVILDQQNSQTIHSLEEDLNVIKGIKKTAKGLKAQLMNLKKFVSGECMQINALLQDTVPGATFPQQPKEEKKSLSRIKKLLSVLVSHETIESFEKLSRFRLPVKILKEFYLTSPEDPIRESSKEKESQRLNFHIKFLQKSLEKLANELLKIYGDSFGQKTELQFNQFEENKFNKSISPYELKTLTFKINKLHNRGSLTDEEARNMLGKISVIPVSPENDESVGFNFRSNEVTLANIICDENPVTETRDKQKLAKSLNKEINRRVKSFKQVNKRCITPGKKILRNTSLPKALNVTKYKNKEKSKFLKTKTKSPHSFM